MRHQATTQKVETPFGAMYVHLATDATGRPAGIVISTPGKADNTQLDEVIRRLAEAADGLIRDTIK